MFSCDSYIVLPIISIILILSIIILVLYKNHTDKLSIIEPFYTVTTTTDPNRADTEQIKSLIDNHKDINNDIKILKNNLNNDYIKSIYDNYLEKLFNKNEISTIFNNNIGSAVESNTNNLIANNEQSVLMEDNITNLKNKLNDLENITNKLKINKIEQNKYSKIKSLNNGQEFCLKQTPKTNFVNPQTGYLTGGYMVNMNDGCLSVGASDYNVYKCND